MSKISTNEIIEDDNNLSKRRDLIIKHNYEYASDYGFYDPLICGSIDGLDEKPHDHGIVRALNSKYNPNFETLKMEPDYTLFIGRINYKTNEDKLRKTFSKYGKIKSLRLVRDFVTGHSKGYAFIEFKHRSDARAAHSNSYKLNLDGRDLIVEFEHERKLKGWKPRRLGGGFGGYKESGQLRFGGRYKPFGRISFRSNLIKQKYHKN